MKLRVLRIAVFSVVLGLSVTPVLAGAPADQYDPFVRADTNVTDHWTTLIWERTARGPATFSAAKATCLALPDVERLPTMKELLTLVDEVPHDEYENGHLVSRSIDQSAFPGTPPEAFWSGTRNAANGSQAWVVNFKTGAASLSDATTATHWYRCVR